MSTGQWILVGAAVIAIIVVIYAGWKGERWFNWRYSYGPKITKEIEIQIKPLEIRVTRLERRTKKRIEQLERRVDELERRR